MANIRKSFSFRNGVQVDEDNFVVNPTTFAVPRTSKKADGTEVPIPTKPLALTTKLSSSTCTPLRKLNDFLIFAIS